MIRFHRPLCALLLGAALAGACVPALSRQAIPAAATLEKPTWKELSRPQQTALEPLQKEWDGMEGARKQKWLDIANKFAGMKPDEQQRLHERMRAWLKMTPEERRVVRENYSMTQKLDKSAKSVQWEQYQQLPEEEKRRLAAEAAAKKQPNAAAPIKPAPVSNVK